MIDITEDSYREGRRGKKLRPFSSSAEVSHRRCSRPLERAVTDFGSDVPFNRIPFKMQEHHGITIPISTARRITLRHGEKVESFQLSSRSSEMPETPGVPIVIAQTDGVLVPTVVTTGFSQDGKKVDKRKNRQVQWREARLSLAHQAESKKSTYAANFNDVKETGRQLFDCVIKSGAGSQTQIHGVGDGASWITSQFEEQFGTQASFLIDFFHLCEYLGKAAKSIGEDTSEWLATQKQRMKENEIRRVLYSLSFFMENPDVPNEEAPVRACYRYIDSRPGQFNYKGALNDGLPIGSGEIESGNRHVIQDRLKRPGAWWAVENIQPMLSLRTLRANDNWDNYWFTQSVAA